MSRSETTPAAPPVPRFALAWASLTYAVAALALGYPALAGRFLVNTMSDQYIAGYAFREFAASTLRTTGHFPLWDPYIFGGLPYVAGMHGDIFYPTFLLRMLMPTDVAMTWSFIVHVFLAGLFTYLFLRAWKLGFAASLAGGLAYMMSGPIAAYVSPGHDGKLYVSALLPLALFLLVRGMRDGKRWSWGALALTVGMAVLSPHPQLLQYLPVFQYIPWSTRAGGIGGYETATSYSFPPEELINTYLPQFSGILDNYWGRNGIHLHSEYLGVVVLLLAGLGIATASRQEKRRSFTWFWIGTGVIALLWSLGGFTPFFRLVYWIVPGTKFFRAPSTMMFMISFAVAVLAALGMERVAAGRVTKRYAAGWLIGGGIMLLLGVTGALTNMAATLATGWGRAELATDNGPQIVFGSVRSFVALALAAVVLLLLVQKRIQPVAAAFGLTALVALDLWSVEHLYWRFSAPASVLYASDSITAFLSKQDAMHRVLAVALDPTDVRHDPELRGDGLMTLRIRTVLGYHGNQLGRYDQLLQRDQGYRQIGNPQTWRLLNIKYLLTDVTPSPIPGAQLVLGPVKDPSGTDTYLYEVPEGNPFAWVAPAIVKGADDAVLATVLDPRFDIARAALFDTAAPVQGKKLAALPDSTGIAVHVTHYAPGAISLELAKPAPDGSALVVSENYYPGWQATVDGKPAPIGRVDYVLIGVALPAGAQKVELTFGSPPFERGKLITLAALALALVWAAGGLLMDRRRAHG